MTQPQTAALARRIYADLIASTGFATVRTLLKTHGDQVRDALDLLSDRKLIMRVRGVGAYVEVV